MLPQTNKKNDNLSKEYSQNLQHHLFDRESGYNRKNLRGKLPPWHLSYERQFYKSITPNLTIQNVDKPLGFMRKFTPDGRLLFSFSHDQRALDVYVYKGVAQALNLLQRQFGECITAADHSLESLYIRQKMFERLFELRCSIRLLPESSRLHLNREFSIFLEDGHYVLLASQGLSVEEPSIEDIFQYHDLSDDCELFDYTFILIDLVKSCISDVAKYQTDCIMLSHNHGVSVHGSTIAVLSKYRQCIDMWTLIDGKLVFSYAIGPFGDEMDRLLHLSVPENNETALEIRHLTLGYLKQRILSHLYREICQHESENVRRKKLREFYKNFKIYERMIIAKMQLIDEDHLLIRYEDRNAQRSGASVIEIEFKLYVFYSLATKQILKIYPNNSVELLYLLRNFCDNFRNIRSLQMQRPSSSPSHNVYFRAAFNSAIASIAGGEEEAALRFCPTLPISTQSFATTQYLDYSLFKYDDHLISALERPKISSAAPIRFSDRNTNFTKFRLFLEAPRVNDYLSTVSLARELVAFIFHPFEPFIISIQKLSTRYVVNFHVYNTATIVKP